MYYPYIYMVPPPVPRCCCIMYQNHWYLQCILIELMHFLQGNFVDQKTKNKKTKNKKTKKPTLAPTMAGILWFFVFLVQGNVAQQIPNVAQHLRSMMRGYVNLCERRHVLGERICESLWKSQGYSDS